MVWDQVSMEDSLKMQVNILAWGFKDVLINDEKPAIQIDT